MYDSDRAKWWDESNSRAAQSQNNAVKAEPSGACECEHSEIRAAKRQTCAIQAEPTGVSEWNHSNSLGAQAIN